MDCFKAGVRCLKIAFLLTLGLSCYFQPVHADEQKSYPIAGVNPDQRPVNAPVISQGPEKNDTWYQNALQGVDKPYPNSLSFLDDQGGWYTPFTRKGMTGPYDIRGWHK